MADVRPFRAVRPLKEYAAQTASLPYDVFSRKEAKEAVCGRPLSFLNIDRPETQFEDDFDMYADEVYEKGRELLYAQIESGIYRKDEKECFYIYELTAGGRSQTGIAALCSVDDYLSGVIKKHENTRAEKELDRIRHIDVLDAQTGPIFLAYRNTEALDMAVRFFREKEAEYDFISDTGVRNRVWVVSDDDALAAIRSAFASMDGIYIADGHHRAASAVKVALKRREENGGAPGEYDRFLAVLFPDSELKILPYNRVVKDLNGHGREEILDMISGDFEIEETGAKPVVPDEKGVTGMLLEDTWYRLRAREHVRTDDPIKGLDVSVLQDRILEPVFGIKDPTHDDRIDFVGGIRGTEELERRCALDCKAAFSMYPTSIKELFAVADRGMLMPPKSTWFEPKLYSGIFIHLLESSEKDR